MYIPPPNAPADQVVYAPDSSTTTVQCSTWNVTHPHLARRMISNGQYPYNFVATTPDYGGRLYARTLGFPPGTIHTEVLSLDLVFPLMFQWYIDYYYFNDTLPAQYTLYLFTYYLPCPSCTDTIRMFLENHTNVTLYVGYTELLGGNNEWDDPNRVYETYQRRRLLRNVLNNNNGYLYEAGQRFLQQCERDP